MPVRVDSVDATLVLAVNVDELRLRGTGLLNYEFERHAPSNLAGVLGSLDALWAPRPNAATPASITAFGLASVTWSAYSSPALTSWVS